MKTYQKTTTTTADGDNMELIIKNGLMMVYVNGAQVGKSHDMSDPAFPSDILDKFNDLKETVALFVFEGEGNEDWVEQP